MERVFKKNEVMELNQEKNKIQERLYSLDLLKTIAIICVIFIHNFYLKANYYEDNRLNIYLNYIIKMLINLGVPIFMMVNGYLLFMKPFRLEKHYTKVLNIIKIFFIWMFIINIIMINFSEKNINGIEIFIKETLQSVKIGGSAGYLWFLYALIQVYILFPLFKITYDNNKKAFYVVFGIIVFFTVILATVGMILSLIENSIKINNLKNTVISFINNFNITGNWGYYTCFFLTGAVIYDNREKISNNKARIIAWICLCISILFIFLYSLVQTKLTNKLVDFNPYNSIFSEIIIISMFVILNKIENKNRLYNKVIMRIGKNSLGIYLFFWIYTKILKNLINNLGCEIYLENIVANAFIVFFVLFISYISNEVTNKIPLLKKIVKI